MCPDKLEIIPGLGVTLYGVCISVGLLACILFFYYFTKKRGMPENVQDFSFFVTVIAIAVGFLFAALYQSVYEWIETGKFVFPTGITVMGGLIGGAATFILAYFVGGRAEALHALYNFVISHFLPPFTFGTDGRRCIFDTKAPSFCLRQSLPA